MGYDFINLTAAMVALYLFSHILQRSGRITVRTHRLVWNALLLFTFAVSTVLGVILVLKINYGYVVKLPLNMLYWHVEAGIAMAVISVFHIIWHTDYFKGALRIPGGKAQAAPAAKSKDAGGKNGVTAGAAAGKAKGAAQGKSAGRRAGPEGVGRRSGGRKKAY
jgi:hypothetical protein